jgi:hypothetical protein
MKMNRSDSLLRLFTVVVLSELLLGGCSLYDGSVESLSWSGSQPLVYNQEAELEVVLRPSWLGDVDVDAMLDASSPLHPIAKSRALLGDGGVLLKFTVVPTGAGRDVEATLRFGRNGNAKHRFRFDVDMPSFAGNSNGSFLELISAPDSSIYGAHITIWSSISTMFVSGHAASNICREITAAVISFATSHSLINDDFFVGAGFASLPSDEGTRQRAFEELGRLLQEASLEDVLLALLDVGATYDLADVIESPDSYKPRSQDAIKFDEIVESGDIESDLNSVVNWINRPSEAVALVRDQSTFEGVIDRIRALSTTQRSALVGSLRKYAALADSADVMQRTAGEVENRSGFIRQRPSLLGVTLSSVGATGRAGVKGSEDCCNQQICATGCIPPRMGSSVPRQRS